MDMVAEMGLGADMLRFRPLFDAGYSFGSGVPCSLLARLIEQVSADNAINYVPCANEAHSIALAAGAAMSGQQSFVLMQNSGLMNALDPLTSLTMASKLPLTLIVSWRGHCDTPDASHHAAAGHGLVPLLDAVGIPWEVCPVNPIEAMAMIRRVAAKGNELQQIVAILVPPGSFLAGPAVQSIVVADLSLPTSSQIVGAIASLRSDQDYVFSTNGHTSRYLADAADHPNNFYVVGAMGLVSSVAQGFGVATSRRCIVIDGDGSFLMHMGAAATIGAARGLKLAYVLLDNACHATTGGQPTVSSRLDICGIASACGFGFVAPCRSLPEFESIFSNMQHNRSSGFLHVRTRVDGRPPPARPGIEPPENAQRMRASLL